MVLLFLPSARLTSSPLTGSLEQTKLLYLNIFVKTVIILKSIFKKNIIDFIIKRIKSIF